MDDARYHPFQLSEGRWVWFRKSPKEQFHAMLPPAVFVELNHFTVGSWRHREYPTRQDAVAALVLAEQNVERRHGSLFV